MSVEILSRIQFALTVSFHFLYPPMTIGLGMMLVIMEGLYLKTKNPLFHQLAHFWTKIFGLIFAIGVATGIVMEFEFGTNWAAYSRFVGDIFGSALAAEGIFAFFLESGFLALLLFGWDKVGPKTHFFATCMVCLGSHFSAIWILIANSWMQTPAGFHLERITGSTHVRLPEGYIVKASDLGHVRAVVDNFWGMIFNPSSMNRISHVVLGAWLVGAFLVMSICAWYLLKGRFTTFAKTSMTVAACFAAFTTVLQSISADATARGVVKNQPIKLASMEGVYETHDYTPMTLFGYVDTKKQVVHGPQIPALLSFLCFHNFKQPVQGLLSMPSDEFLAARNPGLSSEKLAEIRPSYWPMVQAVFQTYHIMICVGSAVFGLSFLALTLLWRGWLFRTDNPLIRFLLWIYVFAVIAPQVCMQAGWFTAEMGRQPWIVYNMLKTSDGLSRAVQANQVVFSIILFSLIYTLLFITFLYLLNSKIQHGPDDDVDHHTKAIGVSSDTSDIAGDLFSRKGRASNQK
ncbi:MAG: cytochrome ubiquinol oxidase subunit I [Verrucomicrobiota bacterium]